MLYLRRVSLRSIKVLDDSHGQTSKRCRLAPSCYAFSPHPLLPSGRSFLFSSPLPTSSPLSLFRPSLFTFISCFESRCKLLTQLMISSIGRESGVLVQTGGYIVLKSPKFVYTLYPSDSFPRPLSSISAARVDA